MGDSNTEKAIAIIGFACVFPGALSAEILWQNVLAGRREFRILPPERLPRDLYYDPDPDVPDKTYSDQVAVITDWSFDPLRFQIPPVTVAVTDTTHWLALHTAAAAFQDSALDLAALDRSRIGVVVGNTLGGEYGRSSYLRYRWPFVERAIRRATADLEGSTPQLIEALIARTRQHYLGPLPEITEDSLAGTMSNTIAGQICSYFDIGGGGYTVDGACSSSLLAIAHACEALTLRRSDVILAGGVDISLDPYELVGFAKARALSAEDIRPYDAHASGMLPGEGCGFFVLMREAEARSLGCHIHALVRGWGYSSDGHGSIVAPRAEGQIRAIRQAYARAGYPISTVELIEGHGTGTPLGDATELAALLEVFDSADHGPGCVIGSIKGNIGHCKAAAGAAGLAKIVMALERHILPPTAGCEAPHPLLRREDTPLRVALEGKAWPGGATPRRASVSGFGFGGANAHLALEEAEPGTAPDPEDLALLGSAQASELLLFAANDRALLLEQIRQVRALVSRISRAELTDLAAALALQQTGGRWRAALVATSLAQLARCFDALIAHLGAGAALATVQTDVFVGEAVEKPRLAALMPGQGTQRPGMAAHLGRRYPFVRALYAAFDEAIADLLPRGIACWTQVDVRHAADAPLQAWADQMRATSVAQPAIVGASLAGLRVLEAHHLIPDIVLGHSLGEISALCVAGVFEPVTGVRIAALRGQAMASLALADPGSMAAVAAEPQVVIDLMAPFGGQLTISSYNAPGQTVVSGSTNAIHDLIRACNRNHLLCQQLPVSHAFHSERMRPAAELLSRILERIETRTPRCAFVSTVSGGFLNAGDDVRRLLIDQIWQPVRFVEAVRCAQSLRPALWVEIGPGNVLAGLTRSILDDDPAPVLTTDAPLEDGYTQLNRVLGQAFVLGFPIDTSSLTRDRFHRPFSLEHYAPRLLVNPCERLASPQTQEAPVTFSPAGTVVQDDLLDFAIQWVARRTGYPTDRINPDARLRDDLGLDSIKYMELVQILQSTQNRRIWPRPGWHNLPLRGLVEAIRGVPGSDEGLPTDQDEPEIGEPWVRTFAMQTVDAPLESEPLRPPPEPPSVYVVASRATRAARAVVSALVEIGAAPTLITLETAWRGDIALDAVGAIVWLLPESDGPAGTPVLEQADVLLRMGHKILGDEGEPSTRRLCLVLRPDPDPARFRPVDAGAVFLRSLELEYPGLATRWVCVPSAWSPKKLGQIAAAEVLREGARAWYAYERDGRRVTDAAHLLDGPQSGPVLGSQDVVLVSGGGKGITAELALTLGQETGARLVIVGTSPVTDPAVQSTLRRLEAAAVTARYYACDVTDEEAVGRTVKLATEALGPITALLHGAGISQPAPFRDTQPDVFRRCIAVKALGLIALLKHCPPAGLKAVHLVSSVLGHTGMACQGDYAYANAWLVGAASELKAAYPQLNVFTCGYSLWKGTGLGEKLGTVDLLGKMGITPLQIQQGTQAYRRLLHEPGGSTVNIVTGRLNPPLERALFPPPPLHRPRFLERVQRWIPGLEISAWAELSHERDPYLPDHVFQGTPMLPAVMGLEAIMAAALPCLQTDVLPDLQDVRLSRPIIVPEAKKAMIYLYARSTGRGAACGIRAETDGYAEDCFAATCSLEPVPEVVEPLALPLPPLASLDIEALVAEKCFQGPIFRQLTGIRCLEPGVACLADVRLPDRMPFFATGEPDQLLTPFPASRDAFFQTILLIVRERGLPTAIRSIHFSRPYPSGASVICRARVVGAEEGRTVVDIDVFTPQGALVEWLHGVVFEAVTGHKLAQNEDVAHPVDSDRDGDPD